MDGVPVLPLYRPPPLSISFIRIKLPMNIKIVVAASLLCAGCAAVNDPFETFYSPGWQRRVRA